jgi:hypothetical protein
MKTTTIITAKIHPNIYELIRTGEKRYEVRDESFRQAHFIRYIDSRTGKQLGVFAIGMETAYGRGDDETLKLLAKVNDDTFDELFPPKAVVLYAAPIRSRRFASIDQAIEEQS